MCNRIVIFYLKYREILTYLFFGFLTVVVNTFLFGLLSETVVGVFGGNLIAFIIAVTFAYWTNTAFVFKSRFTWRNLSQFWGMRLTTLVLDSLFMIVFLYVGINKIIAKLLVNAIIIVLNYILSKFVVYKKTAK